MEVKPGYKQTEVGVIPEEWEVSTLGRIGCSRTVTEAVTRLTWTPAECIPFIKAGHIAEGNLDSNETHYITSEASNRLGGCQDQSRRHTRFRLQLAWHSWRREQ